MSPCLECPIWLPAQSVYCLSESFQLKTPPDLETNQLSTSIHSKHFLHSRQLKSIDKEEYIICNLLCAIFFSKKSSSDFQFPQTKSLLIDWLCAETTTETTDVRISWYQRNSAVNSFYYFIISRIVQVKEIVNFCYVLIQYLFGIFCLERDTIDTLNHWNVKYKKSKDIINQNNKFKRRFQFGLLCLIVCSPHCWVEEWTGGSCGLGWCSCWLRTDG